MTSPKGTPLFGLLLSMVLAASDIGCGGGQGTLPITVAILPASSTVVMGTTTTLTGTVSNDSRNGGINWIVSCPATKCGSISPANTISGTTTTFTAPANLTADLNVTITATSATDATKSATTPITIVLPLSVATTSLPNATGGITYSQTLQATGGLPPYSWTLTSGSSLPAGLSLGGDGTVTGSPTAGGTFSFSVQAADSSSPALTATGKLNLMVVILPLSVSTTSLPDGTVDTAYRQSLQAAGGVLPYTWTITAGSLPSWASLSSQGAIEGIPNSAGNSSFTIEVTDGESTAQTASQPLSVSVTAGSGANNAKLKGQYAFLFNGFDDGTGSPVATVGSFTADGAGKLIDGIEDNNGAGGTALNVPFTGTYNIGSDNRGAFTFQTSSGTKTFACVIGTVNGGVASTGKFIEFDDTTGQHGQRGSGILRLQDATAFSLSSIKGPYALGSVGEDPAGKRSAMVGSIAADGTGNFTSGVADMSVAGAASSPSLTGNYTAPSLSNGKMMLLLNISTTSGWTFGGYVVSAGEVLVMTTNDISSAGLHSGSLLTQKSTAFTNSSLNAPAVLYGSGADTNSPPHPDAEIGLLVPDGNGSVQVTFDQNSAGSVSLNSTFTTTYSVSSNGRTVVPNWGPSANGSTRYLYLVDTNKALYLDSGPAVGFGLIEPQAAAPAGGFVSASLSGTYLSGTAFPTTGTLPTASAQGSLDGTDSFSETVDLSTTGGLIVGQVTTGGYAVSSNGRGTVTSLTTSAISPVPLAIISLVIAAFSVPGLRRRRVLRPVLAATVLMTLVMVGLAGCVFPKPQLVFYVISPTKFVLIDQTKSDTTPTVAIFEQ